MLKCECGKEFETYRQLNGHKSTHNRGDSYRNGRKKNIGTYTCVQCGAESEVRGNKANKFCSNKCQGDYVWAQNKQQIEDGIRPAQKQYMIEKFGKVCSLCGQGDSWNGKELVLQLDHIDGNSDNNEVSNLRLLCPNCHTQTETYTSRGTGPKIRKITKRNRYLRNYQSSEIIGKRT